ncbi:MAG TPA: calcium/sodium antiporter [Aeromonadales bacterium]|nr:calcium/sodium antiporter [Aeromonadales bacterium]
MLFNFAWVLIGISLLVWSADRLTDGAAAIANNLGVPPFIVGLTIIAVGSSAPELFISTVAAIAGKPGLAIGNAIGSNIVNTSIVLPIAALISPLVICSNILRREMPLLLVFSALTAFFLYDLSLSRLEGFILVGLLILYIIWLIFSGFQNHNKDKLLTEMVGELPETMPTPHAIIWVIVGLIVLMLSSDLLVDGATNIARAMGISDTIIGLTIVAIGTSLPELAASIAGALKKEHEMVLGNIIGSNIFNLLGVLGIAGSITPIKNLDPEIMSRDIPTMLIVTVSMYLLAQGYGKRAHFGIRESIALLLVYLVYAVILFTDIV